MEEKHNYLNKLYKIKENNKFVNPFNYNILSEMKMNQNKINGNSKMWAAIFYKITNYPIISMKLYNLYNLIEKLMKKQKIKILQMVIIMY